jgi:tRNA 2-thiouridine synthesizing protein A
MTIQHEDPIVIDGGDRVCITLLLELRSHLAAMPGGTLVHLLATDPAAPLDLAAWCHMTGHTYLGPIPAIGDTPVYALRVSSDARPTRPDSPWRPRTLTLDRPDPTRRSPRFGPNCG